MRRSTASRHQHDGSNGQANASAHDSRCVHERCELRCTGSLAFGWGVWEFHGSWMLECKRVMVRKKMCCRRESAGTTAW